MSADATRQHRRHAGGDNERTNEHGRVLMIYTRELILVWILSGARKHSLRVGSRMTSN